MECVRRWRVSMVIADVVATIWPSHLQPSWWCRCGSEVPNLTFGGWADIMLTQHAHHSNRQYRSNPKMTKYVKPQASLTPSNCPWPHRAVAADQLHCILLKANKGSWAAETIHPFVISFDFFFWNKSNSMILDAIDTLSLLFIPVSKTKHNILYWWNTSKSLWLCERPYARCHNESTKSAKMRKFARRRTMTA